VVGIDDAVDVVSGSYHTCARRRSGQVQCWGDNTSGQVGVSNTAGSGTASAREPVDVLGLP
jgi:alpha-tubulin suppressor-like RCC1 family protein